VQVIADEEMAPQKKVDSREVRSQSSNQGIWDKKHLRVDFGNLKKESSIPFKKF